MSEQNSNVEPWLRGPIEGIVPQLTPIAYSLMQVMEELPRIVAGISGAKLWVTPGGAASIGFHLKHLAGSLDRLYTYARGEKLSNEQFKALDEEKSTDEKDVNESMAKALSQIEKAIQQLREAKAESLHETRFVGRAQLPSTQLALLYHGAEHVQRHVGAIIATAKVLSGNSQVTSS